MTVRKYFVGNLERSAAHGGNSALRAEAAFTMRVQRNHLVSLKYITSRRDSSHFEPSAPTQRRDTIGIYYTYQPSDGFGIVGM
jgi:hypothetical protein